MPEFAYRAADASGKSRDGRIDASSREAALRTLKSRGLTPLKLDEAGSMSAIVAKPEKPAAAAPAVARRGRFINADRGPDHNDIHNFTSELAVMLRAGLPLDRALKVLIGMSTRPSFAALLEDVFKSVKSGKGFSQALAPHQALFGDFYVNMVRSGEAGGQLADVLSRLAEHLERVKALRESVISALIYPAILVVVAVISVFLMLGFVVPQFEALFEDMGEALPLPTEVVVAAGHLIADWGWLVVIVVVGVGWSIRRWFATPAGRQWRDTRLLRVPVLGEVVRKYEITRFARSMGTLLGNGVPIVNAIKIATDTMGNHRLRAAMANVAPSIKQGGRLADALEQSALFTPLAVNMVRLGEETGRLDSMLLELARVHDAEVQSGVKRALTLIEPLLILTLGAIIAAIIVSILMGILSVNELAV
ncbi:MAG TPA: type II secretion system F family protein [Azoarcus taiwanensis]|nr:type II secretion system F family protein [Azoarcus taiwanensis]